METASGQKGGRGWNFVGARRLLQQLVDRIASHAFACVLLPVRLEPGLRGGINSLVCFVGEALEQRLVPLEAGTPVTPVHVLELEGVHFAAEHQVKQADGLIPFLGEANETHGAKSLDGLVHALPSDAGVGGVVGGAPRPGKHTSCAPCNAWVLGVAARALLLASVLQRRPTCLAEPSSVQAIVER